MCGATELRMRSYDMRAYERQGRRKGWTCQLIGHLLVDYEWTVAPTACLWLWR